MDGLSLQMHEHRNAYSGDVSVSMDDTAGEAAARPATGQVIGYEVPALQQVRWRDERWQS